MRIEIDDSLLAETFHHLPVTSLTDLVQLALTELLARHSLPTTVKPLPIPPTELFSLEAVVVAIQQLPKTVANCQPASGLLAEHLRDSPKVDSAVETTG